MSWLDEEPARWKVIIAGDGQNCPDGCGQAIIAGETRITNAAGPWRREDCARKQWDDYQVLHWGTKADFEAAWKRVLALGGHAVARRWTQQRGSRSVGWTEYVP